MHLFGVMNSPGGSPSSGLYRRAQGLLEAGPDREQLGFVQSAKCLMPGAVLDTGMDH